jgi:Cu-Zn family superoxide dismutase
MTRTMTFALTLTILTGAGLAACETDDPPAPRDAIAGGGGSTGDAAGTGGADGNVSESDAADAGAVSDAGAVQIGTSGSAAFTIYPQPDAGVNFAMNIAGSATAWDIGGGMMRLELHVSGLLPGRPFGAHLHKLPCEMNMAGGHYQHTPAPDPDAGAGPGGPNDPNYANPTNEAWLDFTTDTNGMATSTAMVPWVPEAAKAKSIVIHAMTTAPGGVAGPKLACLAISFQ